MNETMTLERLMTIVDAYGASPARWPQDERQAAETFAAANPAAQALLASARALDEALDGSARFAPSAELYGRALASFDAVMARPSVRRVIDRIAYFFWPDAPLWKPSAALAASLAAGLLLGAMSPLTVPVASPDPKLTVAMDAPASTDDGL
jgi:hypothetical protein